MLIKTLGWLVFVMVQLVMFVAAFVGLFLLIPFCLLKAWKLEGHSIKDGRLIDRWVPNFVNYVYGNPEDGVSGQTALVWNDEGQLRPYLPDAGPRWRAYCWSAWRNSADGLKYLFRWLHGPFYRWENKAHTLYFQAGFNPSGFPVLSAGRM